MPSAIRVGDIRAALTERLFPSVTMWNRLEGRPRTQDFQRALQAEVRDALWMLSRQWQLGEFRGSDAGSPVFAKVRVDSSTLTRYRPGDTGTGSVVRTSWVAGSGGVGPGGGACGGCPGGSIGSALTSTLYQSSRPW